jgi:hypothetical protein
MYEKAVGVKYDIDRYLGSYIAAAQKAICELTADELNAMKYDKPCCSYKDQLQKGLFLKFCLENIDCYTDDEKNKIISLANRFSQNCSSCTVTQEEIDAFGETDLGKDLKKKYSIDPDVQAFLDETLITDDVIVNALITLVKQLKEQELWSKMYAIYPFVGGSLTTKAYNLRDVSTHTIGWGTGAIDDPKGVDFDGTTSAYGDTNLNFKTLGYSTIENMHISFYTPDDRALVRSNPWGAIQEFGYSDDRISFTFDPLPQNYFVDMWADNNTSSRLAVTPGTDNGDKGFYVVTTASATDLRIRHDKVQTGSFTSTRDANPVPDLDLYIGNVNIDNTTDPSILNTRVLGFVTVGQNLTNTEADKLDDIVSLFNTALAKK